MGRVGGGGSPACYLPCFGRDRGGREGGMLAVVYSDSDEVWWTHVYHSSFQHDNMPRINSA